MTTLQSEKHKSEKPAAKAKDSEDNLSDLALASRFCASRFRASVLVLLFLVVARTIHAADTVATLPLSAVKVYPNPWRADQNSNSLITFDHLPQPSTVKIFTVSGHEIRTLSSDNGNAGWDCTNSAGDKVASGIYLYLITDNQGNLSKGKLAIIH